VHEQGLRLITNNLDLFGNVVFRCSGPTPRNRFLDKQLYTQHLRAEPSRDLVFVETNYNLETEAVPSSQQSMFFSHSMIKQVLGANDHCQRASDATHLLSAGINRSRTCATYPCYHVTGRCGLLGIKPRLPCRSCCKHCISGHVFSVVLTELVVL
jgi:hypothetical protein